MPHYTILSGAGFTDLSASISAAFADQNPRVVAIASAFVSSLGIESIRSILPPGRVGLRLVAGTSLSFTHPNALRIAERHGWQVRLAGATQGIFHPKVIIGGSRFGDDGTVEEPCVLYIGSANLTRPALTHNVECGMLYRGTSVPQDATLAYRSIWSAASDLTPDLLRQYSSAFTRRNRSRTSRDLQELGVSDSDNAGAVNAANLREQDRPDSPALDYSNADSVWVGLETATGGYTYQPEFPKIVGEMVQRMALERGVPATVHGEGANERHVYALPVRCSDGEVREMTFTYYSHNSMSRLNIPNAVPNAEWARANRAGIAHVTKLDGGEAVLELEILKPGDSADECVRRSFLLGTWKATTTRSYGWF